MLVLETDRLLLRPWRVVEAGQRELWTERDPRVPPHRRIDADGHPTVEEIAEAIRTNKPSSIGLLAVERKAEGEVIGYCGPIESDRGAVGEPELAVTGFVPPATLDSGLASIVLRVQDRAAWRSAADAAWLVVDNVPPHRADEGDLIVVTEGRRVVAYFHIEAVDDVV